MTFIFALIVSLYGFLHFAMCVKKHHSDIYSTWLKAEYVTRREFYCFQLFAWLCMGVSLALSCAEWGLGIGIMAWLLLIAVAATALVAAISYQFNWVALMWRHIGFARYLTPPKVY